MPDATRIPADRLSSLIARIFEAAGASPPDAETVADVLVEADLRGVESHGSTRVAGYVSMIRLGFLNPKPDVRVVRDTSTTAMLEGDRASGIVVAKRAMQMAMDKARAAGLGAVTARNVTHTGLVGFYPMMAARAGLIGVAMNNGPAILPPFGGITPTYATNPFAAAFPAGRREPIVLDMATSVVAGGKLRLAAKNRCGDPRHVGPRPPRKAHHRSRRGHPTWLHAVGGGLQGIRPRHGGGGPGRRALRRPLRHRRAAPQGLRPRATRDERVLPGHRPRTVPAVARVPRAHRPARGPGEGVGAGLRRGGGHDRRRTGSTPQGRAAARRHSRERGGGRGAHGARARTRPPRRTELRRRDARQPHD